MLTWLIFGFGVFIAFQMFNRHRGAVSAALQIAAGKQRPASTPNESVWTWGRGVWGLVLGESEKVLSAEVAKSFLEVSWGIAGRASFDEVIARMDDYPERKIWRDVRTATLLRLAVVSGLLSERECTRRMTEIQIRLRDTCDDWEELADGFEREHADFMSEGFDASSELEERQLGRFPLTHHMKTSRARLAREVWPDLAFSED